MTQNAARLYHNAVAMDRAFADALTAAGLDRWESPRSDWPKAVRNAYAHKRQADEACRLDAQWTRAETRTEQDAAVREYHAQIDRIMADV